MASAHPPAARVDLHRPSARQGALDVGVLRRRAAAVAAQRRDRPPARPVGEVRQPVHILLHDPFLATRRVPGDFPPGRRPGACVVPHASRQALLRCGEAELRLRVRARLRRGAPTYEPVQLGSHLVDLHGAAGAVIWPPRRQRRPPPLLLIHGVGLRQRRARSSRGRGWARPLLQQDVEPRHALAELLDLHLRDDMAAGRGLRPRRGQSRRQGRRRRGGRHRGRREDTCAEFSRGRARSRAALGANHSGDGLPRRVRARHAAAAPQAEALEEQLIVLRGRLVGLQGDDLAIRGVPVSADATLVGRQIVEETFDVLFRRHVPRGRYH
mmetsp:Transcript_102234/g.286611  ORF Transcript_102234/g.286611 Transcript_102234/m.286611 type:complete len:326 (-) Transcript_102234:456-1433(-)